MVPAEADPSQPRGDGWGVLEEPRAGKAVAPAAAPGSATTDEGAVSDSGGVGGAAGVSGAVGAGGAAAGSAAAGGVALRAACRIASPSSDLMGLSRVWASFPSETTVLGFPSETEIHANPHGFHTDFPQKSPVSPSGFMIYLFLR